MVSSSISLPLSGFFSSFPHGTCSLSVSKEYFALEGGPPRFRQDFSCPILLRILAKLHQFKIRGLHPLWRAFPDTSPTSSTIMQVLQPRITSYSVWANPRSLAATSGISVDYFSCRYLDVSVPCVRSLMPTWLSMELHLSPDAELPHSEIPGSKPIWRLSEAYRGLINVLLRLLLPRYPPYTLSSFLFFEYLHRYI